MDKEISNIIRDIKELRIQGARNVSKAVIKAFSLYVEKEKEENKIEFIKKSIKFAMELMNSRPTEPMTRNLIKEIISYLLFSIENKKGVEDIKEYFKEREERIYQKFYESKERISDIGATYIKEGSTIMTYCHSSTVTGIIKKAFDYGKVDKVYSCETRPKFQGRITAKELSEYGVRTIQIVDGAMARFMKKVDFVIVGADAITSTGDLINKIGSLTLAITANYYHKPFISASEIYKFDPETLLGFRERIEEREAEELWDFKHKNFEIRNPAFDLVPHNLISEYITDSGIILPEQFQEKFKEREKFLF